MKSKYGEITVINNTTFKDKYNRLILLDKATKKTYFIEDIEQKMYRFLDSRVLIVILVFVLATSVWDLTIALIVSSLLFLAFEIYFRKFFIPNLREAKDFPVPEKVTRINQLGKKDSKTLLLMTILSLLLPVLLVYYVLEQTANFANFSFENINMTSLVLGSTVIGLFSLYIAVCCFIALLKKKK